MASAWQKELNLLKSMDAFSTPTKILSMIYEKTLPTAKKVITLFEYDCKNDNERDCIAFLKRYVKGLDVSLLKKFLIFCTGSDIINVSKIEITFTMPESEYARQPVAHTCGPVLELPCTYRNFPEHFKVFILGNGHCLIIFSCCSIILNSFDIVNYSFNYHLW